MKRYTNTLLAGLYALGFALIVATLLIIRFRLDRAIELTV